MKDAELIENLRANGGDGMWVEQAINLVKTLCGSRVDPQSLTLLDDMNAERFDNPKISDWLYKLPGHRVGDMTTAERHLSYLTGQFKSASKKGASDERR